jgi:phosphate/sulfate permease
VKLRHNGVRPGAAELLGRREPARHGDREIDAVLARAPDALERRRDGDRAVGVDAKPPRAPRRCWPRTRRSDPRGDAFDLPTWVVVACATAIALGTYCGGWRILKTLGCR